MAASVQCIPICTGRRIKSCANISTYTREKGGGGGNERERERGGYNTYISEYS